MSLGLSEEELTELASFGKTREEAADNLYGPAQTDHGQLFDHIRVAFQRRMIELILKNNERIAKQLRDAGVHLPG